MVSTVNGVHQSFERQHEMADPDPRKQELIDKVSALVARRFGGDWDRAFEYYAKVGGAAGLVNDDGVSKILKDAGYGWAMRGLMTGKVLEALDTDKDNAISLTEFRKVFQN